MRELILHDTTPGCHFHDCCPRLAHIIIIIIIHIYTIYSLYLSKPYDLFSLSTRNCLFQESFFRMSLVYAQLPSSNKIYIRVTGKCRSNKAYFSEYIWQICDKKICKRLFLYYYNKRSRLNSEPSEGSVSANYKYRELFSTVSEEEFMCSFLFVKKRPNIMNFPQEIKKKY